MDKERIVVLKIMWGPLDGMNVVAKHRQLTPGKTIVFQWEGHTWIARKPWLSGCFVQELWHKGKDLSLDSCSRRVVYQVIK